MSDLILIPSPSNPKEKATRDRVEKIGQLVDKAEQLLAAPIPDLDAIEKLAIEMREFGMIIASRTLLDKIGR